MKKFMAALCALVLLAGLSGCGPFVSIMPGTELILPGQEEAAGDSGDAFRESALFSFLGWDELENFYADTPIALSYQPEAGEDGVQGCRSYVFDRASIIAACEALRGMTVTGRAGETPPAGAEYALTMPSGAECAATFARLPDGGVILRAYTGDYTVSGGEALFDIAFPVYSGRFDAFDLYFDESVRAFADGFFENEPVSVGYRFSSGATISSTDPAAVEAAFRAIANATVTMVENRPDQNIDLTNIRDYIFTMEDGSTQTFRFADQCLAVTASQSFGPVYYWLDGIGALWAVNIVPESTVGQFEGGSVAGLREETQLVADVVNGVRDDLSIAGVFVDYTIGEQSAYLTLSDEVAAEFLRTLFDVEAGTETVESPEGDTIAVSITLSDSSGPLISFTGDTIQQVVGVNYVCDSGDMAALRSAILELAEQGNNTGTIEESTNE